jgi:RNA polymerase sigma-70 factor (ECF subfamily)
MSSSDDISASSPTVGSQFQTTHWSVVLSARDGTSTQAHTSLAQLCGTYWYPLYAYVRRRGFSPAEAEDSTQDFFTRLLEKQSLSGLRREGGRFRSFLLGAMANFLADEWDRAQTQKRGSGRKPLSLDAEDGEARFQALAIAGELTPESIFEKQWAVTLLEHVAELLRVEEVKSSKGDPLEGMMIQLIEPRTTSAFSRCCPGLTPAGGRLVLNSMSAR